MGQKRPRSEGAGIVRGQLDLPILNAKLQLLKELRDWKTLILIGETGSGKTTQLPQIVLDGGLSKGGRIACTQPRRVAAMSVAQRVARERQTKLGYEVGYSVRFDDKSSPGTRLKYLTDGMLLREALLDPLLKAYKVIILDEAHERSLQTDILFSLVKSAQKERDDLQVIVMSATLDAAKFLEFFPNAAAAYLKGRQYPVETLYLEEPIEDYSDAALTTIFQIHRAEGSGHILVFLTGQEEIENLQYLIQERLLRMDQKDKGEMVLEVLTIFAAQSPEHQMRIFEPAQPNSRRVILATNIAETSVTVPGVRFVIDCGFVKARFFKANEAVESLLVVPVSQAQARQRTGRAGREAPGKCYRLYTESAFFQLPETTAPEIVRVRLSEVVLTLKAIGIGDLRSFDFLDKPQPAAMTRALEQLLALGALDVEQNLTKPIGFSLARLPIDPCLGKVLVSAILLNCKFDALCVVSMASSDAAFSTSRQHAVDMMNARKAFLHPSGDHLTLMNVFKAYLKVDQDRNSWCKTHFLNARALKKAKDIYKQLEGHTQNLKIHEDKSSIPSRDKSSVPSKEKGQNDEVAILQAITAGYFLHAATRQEDGTYKVLHSKQTVQIHPSSVLCGKKAKCIVFGELMQTTQKYAHCVSAIDSAWLPEIAPTIFS